MEENVGESQPLLNNHGPSDEVKTNRLTCLMGAFLLINTTIGAGLLNFPTAFYQAGGIFNTVLIQLVILVLIIISMHFLLLLSYPQLIADGSLKNFESYEEVMEYYCGTYIKFLVSWVVILYSFGTCITYLIIIADQEEKIIDFLVLGDKKPWYLRRNFDLFIISCLTILPFSFSKNIDFLKYPSAAGVLSMVYIPFVIMYKYYSNTINDENAPTLNKLTSHQSHLGLVGLAYQSHADIFRVIPVICFLYNCQLSVVPIYHCMKSKSILYFSKSIFLNIIICGLLYNITGIYGYLSFGDKVLINTDILTAYNPNDYKVFIAMVLLVGKIITTYPIVLFCARLALDGMWIKLVSMEAHSIHRTNRVRRLILASTWFALTLAITLFVPDIGKVIPFLGSLSLLIIFVFPAFGIFRKIENYKSQRCVVGDDVIPTSDLDAGIFYSDPSAPDHVILLPPDFRQRAKHFVPHVMYGFAVLNVVLGTFLFGTVVTQSVMDLVAKP